MKLYKTLNIIFAFSLNFSTISNKENLKFRGTLLVVKNQGKKVEKVTRIRLIIFNRETGFGIIL